MQEGNLSSPNTNFSFDHNMVLFSTYILVKFIMELRKNISFTQVGLTLTTKTKVAKVGYKRQTYFKMPTQLFV